MSAAAPKAHRRSADPDSKQPRGSRGEPTDQFGKAVFRQRQMEPLRGRSSYQLPCGP